jgi:hypothetical protein
VLLDFFVLKNPRQPASFSAFPRRNKKEKKGKEKVPPVFLLLLLLLLLLSLPLSLLL